MAENIHSDIAAALAVIPATVAAVGVIMNNRKGKKVYEEVRSPNGTTSAQAIQDIKHSVSDLHGMIVQHTERDDIVQRDIVARLKYIEGKVN